MDISDLPECCLAQLRQIERILSAGQALEILLSIAPSLTTPRPRGITTIMSALWNIAKAGASFTSNRQRLRGSITQIVRSRVRTVIELSIVRHEMDGNRELVRHWTRMLEAF